MAGAHGGRNVYQGMFSTAAGKVIDGLARHRPCVTDLSGLTTYELKAYEWEMSILASRVCDWHPLRYLCLVRVYT